MLIYIIIAIIYFFVFVPYAQAVCPVCTLAIGAGVGLSRYLGIDDTISGVWIGGLIISSAFWLVNWAKKKKIPVISNNIISVLIFYLFVLPPLFFTNIIGHPLNTLWGIDRLLLGIITGSILFILSVKLDKYLRVQNNSKVYISYQKVIIPVSLLFIASLIFYIITR